MKQIHLRLDDNDYDKLVKEATFHNISLNKLIANCVTEFKEQPHKPMQDSSKLFIEIHKDLTNILIELNSLKTIILETIINQDKSENLSEAEQVLAKSITETKQEMLKHLLLIQKKLSKVSK